MLPIFSGVTAIPLYSISAPSIVKPVSARGLRNGIGFCIPAINSEATPNVCGAPDSGPNSGDPESGDPGPAPNSYSPNSSGSSESDLLSNID